MLQIIGSGLFCTQLPSDWVCRIPYQAFPVKGLIGPNLHWQNIAFIPGCERYWIEEGSHLGFWLSPHAQEAQKMAVEFLEKHCPKDTIN